MRITENEGKERLDAQREKCLTCSLFDGARCNSKFRQPYTWTDGSRGVWADRHICDDSGRRHNYQDRVEGVSASLTCLGYCRGKTT